MPEGEADVARGRAVEPSDEEERCLRAAGWEACERVGVRLWRDPVSNGVVSADTALRRARKDAAREGRAFPAATKTARGARR